MQDKCILAIDCATGPCSVAVWKSGSIAAYAEDLRPVVQSARLLPMVEDALASARITYADLTSVACTTGPGSFTGIRIGLAAARGIAYAAKISGIGFSTLEVMAHGIHQAHQTIFAILNAGKGEWYHQAFSTAPEWHALTPARLSSPEIAASTCPPGAQWVGNIEAPATIRAFPSADWLAELAAISTESTPLAPFYIRPPDITMPKNKK